MNALFYILALAICVVILLIIIQLIIPFIRICRNKIKTGHSDYSGNINSAHVAEKESRTVSSIASKTKELDVESYAADIIKKCRATHFPKNFVKEVCKDETIDNDEKIEVLQKIILIVESISYEELLSLANEFSEDFSGEISADKISNTDKKTLSKDEFKTISQYLGMDCLKNLIKNDTFSWEYIKDAWEEAYHSHSYDALGTYFSSNSGKKYWEDASAKPLLNDLIAHLCENETSQGEIVSEEFLKAFAVKIELSDLNNETEIDDYVNTLEKFGEADIRKFFAEAPIAYDESSDGNDEIREIDLMMTSLKLFKLWLEETPEIHSNYLFSYLVWNNILPKRFENNSRLEESLKTLNEYKDKKVPNLSSERYEEIISYVKEIKGEADFLDRFVESEKYIPLLFWKNLNDDGKWEDMSENDAMEILDKNYGYADKPYVVYSYVKAGYKLSSEYFSTIVAEGLVQVAKLYFELHHKDVLSK